MTALAQRLVAHPRWRWQPGMLYTRTMYAYRAPASCEGVTFGAECVPCLDDPATKGWGLAMLREATGAGCYATEPALARDGEEWEVWDYHGSVLGRGTTEGDAIFSTLLTTWGEP